MSVLQVYMMKAMQIDLRGSNTTACITRPRKTVASHWVNIEKQTLYIKIEVTNKQTSKEADMHTPRRTNIIDGMYPLVVT